MGAALLALMLPAFLLAGPPPGSDTPFAPQTVAAACSGTQQVTGSLRNASGNTVLSRITSATNNVYGYITSVQSVWTSDACLKYGGWAVRYPDGSGTVWYDQGNMIRPASSNSYNVCNYVVGSGDDWFYASSVNAGSNNCSTLSNYLDGSLPVEGVYNEDTTTSTSSISSTAGSFKFIWLSCSLPVGSLSAEYVGNASSLSNCASYKYDATGTNQMITYDKTKPASTASNGTYTNSRTVPVAWVASDGVAGVSSITVYASDTFIVGATEITCGTASVANLKNASGSINCTTTSDGIWYFRSKATDANGNVEGTPSSYDTNIYVDTVNPAVSFGAPASGGPAQATSPYDVTFSATDASPSSGFTGPGAGWSLQRQIATYSGTCGTFADDTAVGNLVTGTTNASGQISSQTLASGSCYRWVLNAKDSAANNATAVTSGSVSAGSIPVVVVTDNTAGLGNAYRSGSTVFFKSTAGGSVQLTATGTDSQSTITANTFGALSGTPTGWSPSSLQTSASNPYAVTYTWSTSSPSTTTSVTSRNASNTDSVPVVITMTPDGAAPVTSFTTPAAGGPAMQSGTALTVTFSATDATSGFGKSGAGWSLQRQIAAATAGVCGTFANDTAAGNLATGQTNATGQTSAQTLVSGSCYRWVLNASDSVGIAASALTSGTVLVDTSAPAAPVVTDNSPAGSYRTGNTIYFRPAAAGTITLTSTGTDAQSGIASSTFGALSAGAGWTYTSSTVAGNPANKNLTWSGTAVSATLPVTTTNGANTASGATTITFTSDAVAPTISSFLPATGTASQTSTSFTVSWTETEAGSGVAARSLQRQKFATTSSANCAGGSYTNDGAAQNVTSPKVESGMSGDTCYRWTLTVTDRVGNVSATSTSGMVFVINVAPPTPGAPDLDTDSDTGPRIDTAGSVILRPNSDAYTEGPGSLTYYPSGPPGWPLIDEVVLDTADKVEINYGNNVKILWGFTSSGLTSADIITSVKFTVHGRAESLGNYYVRNPATGTLYAIGKPSQSFGNPTIMTLIKRPWDGAPWTTADVEALQMGVGIPSTGGWTTVERLQVDVGYRRFTATGIAPVNSTNTPTLFDDVTNDNTPSLSGTYTGTVSSVELYDGTTLVGTDSAPAGGVWHITTGTLADGVHNLTAKAINAGNPSPASSALAVTIDTTPPATPSTPDLTPITDDGVDGTDNITSVAAPQFVGIAGAGAITVGLFDGTRWVAADNAANTTHAAEPVPANSARLIFPGATGGINGSDKISDNFTTTAGDQVVIHITQMFSSGNVGMSCTTGNQNVFQNDPNAGQTITFTANGGTCYIYSWTTDQSRIGAGWFTAPSLPATMPPAPVVGSDGYRASAFTTLVPGTRSFTAVGYDLAGNESTASSGLQVKIVQYLNSVEVSAVPATSVGQTVFAVGNLFDELERPLDSLVKTLTVSTNDPTAVFPDGASYSMTALVPEAGHAFRVMFGTPGTYTITITGNAVVLGTREITVEGAKLTASAPETVYQGVPFKFNVATKTISDRPAPAYAALVTFSSSDSTATYDWQVDGNKQYQFACGCDGTRAFYVGLSTLGIQTVTVTDQFGTTSFATVNVVVPPNGTGGGGGAGTPDPISRIDAVQWNGGDTVDYYVTMVPGSPAVTFRLVADICGVGFGTLSVESLSETIAAGQLYGQFTVKMPSNGMGCYYGAYAASIHRLTYTDGSGQWQRSLNSLSTRFSNMTGNANFTMIDPGDPLSSVTNVSRGDSLSMGEDYPIGEDGSPYARIKFGLLERLVTTDPITIFSVGYQLAGANPGYNGPENQHAVVPDAGTYDIYFDDIPWACYAVAGNVHVNASARITYTGHNGRIGAQNFSMPTGGVTWPPNACNSGAPGGGRGWGEYYRPTQGLDFNLDWTKSPALDNISRFLEADPIDPFNGALTQDVTDFTIGGLTPSLHLYRTYRSDIADFIYKGSSEVITATRLFGAGWSSPFDQALSFSPDPTTIVQRGADGGQVTWKKNTSGVWRSEGMGTRRLAAISGGWKITDDAGAGYRFNGNGRLVAQFDGNGRELTLSYDGSGYLTTITDPAGRVATVTTNGNGRITRIDLPGGRAVSYTYSGGYLATTTDMAGTVITYSTDRRGRIKAIKNAAGDVLLSNVYDDKGRVITQGDADGRGTYFAYNRKNSVTQIVGPRGDVVTDCFTPTGATIARLDPLGGKRTWAYSGRGDVVTAVDELGAKSRAVYDTSHQVVTATDTLGRNTSVTWDADGHPTVVTSIDGTTTTTFDPATRLPLTITKSDATNSLQTAAYTYYSGTNLLKTATDANGGVITYHYDSYGYVDYTIDAMGHKTTFVTDPNTGFLTSTVGPLGNVSGGVPGDNKTTYTYDNMGRALTVVDPLGNMAGGNVANHRTTYTYDDFGRIKTVARNNGSLQTFQYDLLGRTTSSTVKLTSSLNAVTTYEYDVAGNLTAVVDPEGRRTETTYDIAGQPVANTDSAGKTSTIKYDAKGRITKTTDATGVSSSVTFDSVDRVIKAKDAAGKETTFSYSPTTGQLELVTNPLGNTTAYEYDWLGRQTKVINAKNQAATNTYDNLGQVLSVTNARNKTTAFTYNANGQLLTITEPGNTGNFVTTYAYDNVGRLTSRQNARGASESYVYDNLGRLTDLTDANSKTWRTFYTNNGLVNHTIDGKGQTTQFAYDLGGRLLSTTPDAPTSAIVYTYDKSGRLMSMADGSGASTYAHDSAGRLSSLTRNGRTTSYTYDDAGRSASVVYPGNLGTVSYTYDTAGRANTITDWAGRVTTYHYDDASRVTSVDRPGGLTTSYTYDELNRPLTAVSTRSSSTILSQAWAYDPNGNITTMTDDTGAATFTYDNLDRLLTASYPSSQNYTYTYDSVGNMLTAVTPSGTATYAYDLGDRITSVGPGTAPDTTAPSTPTGLGATAVGANRINLAWTASTDAVGVTKYTINRAGTPIATVDGNTTTFSDFSVAPATAYTYTVSASDAAGNTSASSTSASATSGAASGAPGSTSAQAPTTNDTGWTNSANAYVSNNTYATAAPAKNGTINVNYGTFGLGATVPSNATITNVTVSVEWKVSTTGSNPTLGSQLYAGGVAKGTELTNATSPTSDTVQTYTVSGLTRADLLDGTLTIRVRASRGSSNTAVTASLDAVTVQVDYTTPAAPDTTAPSVPSGLTATASGNNRVNLAWTASTDDIAVQGYKIFRDTIQVGTLPVGTVTFSDTGVSAGSHSYTVAAVDGAGNVSVQSTSASATATTGGGAGVAPTYDDNGNMTSDGTYGNRTYAYDTMGRLIGVTIGGVTTTYTVDGSGNRWSQTTGAATTTFDLDITAGDASILYDGTAKFLPGAPGAGAESGGVWRSNLVDLIGSPIMSVDTAGNVSGATHYDPYGAPRPGSSAAAGIGYGGEYRDATGLINLRFRSYDPVLGRFIGRDSFEGVSSAPQTGNRYAYATANPMRYTDPSGHFVNAAFAIAPTVAELAITFNPAGAALVMAYTLVTGTDPFTGEKVDSSTVLVGAAAFFGPLVAVKVLEKTFAALRVAREGALAFRDYTRLRALAKDAAGLKGVENAAQWASAMFGHSERVALASYKLARAEGMGVAASIRTARIGLMHDTGKFLPEVATDMAPWMHHDIGGIPVEFKGAFLKAQDRHGPAGADWLTARDYETDIVLGALDHHEWGEQGATAIVAIADGLEQKARFYNEWPARSGIKGGLPSWKDAGESFWVRNKPPGPTGVPDPVQKDLWGRLRAFVVDRNGLGRLPWNQGY